MRVTPGSILLPYDAIPGQPGPRKSGKGENCWKWKTLNFQLQRNCTLPQNYDLRNGNGFGPMLLFLPETMYETGKDFKNKTGKVVC